MFISAKEAATYVGIDLKGKATEEQLSSIGCIVARGPKTGRGFIWFVDDSNLDEVKKNVEERRKKIAEGSLKNLHDNKFMPTVKAMEELQHLKRFVLDNQQMIGDIRDAVNQIRKSVEHLVQR